ncbi:MAG: DUF5810 domain-containing protein [Natronomonas sp.]
MGYACPVCSDPQADAGHLANHLGFTAILGEDDHEAWLDEHAPGWSEMSEDELAEIVSEHVEETDFPQLFEDTVGGLDSTPSEPLADRSGALFENSHGSKHQHEHTEHGSIDTSGPMDEETVEILEEAKEMTREMLEDGEDGQE